MSLNAYGFDEDKKLRTDELQKQAKLLLNKWCGEDLEKIESINSKSSGSHRKYHRVFGRRVKAVLCENKNRRENEAFIYLSKIFRDNNLNVPAIYSHDLDLGIYLVEDLGEQTLYDTLRNPWGWAEVDFEAVNHFKKVVSILPKFQIDGAQRLDFSKCYPVPKFDKISMKWDFNYFKYYFLKQAIEEIEEDVLENTFDEFIKLLLDSDDDNYFVYRDFQSRNIMLKNNDYYFIDYQGGRMGALQYDLASILFSGSIKFTEDQRKILYETYLTELSRKIKIDIEKFERRFYFYAIFRVLQLLGAYSFRGGIQLKTDFSNKIPNAVDYIDSLLSDKRFPNSLNYLKVLFDSLDRSHREGFVIHNKNISLKTSKLKVTVKSFSYKDGIPEDTNGNGGGFVFDCRSINNPGRLEEYKALTGRDKEVISFLETKSEAREFLDNVYSTITPSIQNYLERDFENLAIYFGCTGGQHRSVYCAEKTAEMIRQKFNISVEVIHRELEKSGKV